MAVRKNRGAAGLLTLIVLLVATAFALLSLRDERFDVAALMTGGILVIALLAHYVVLTGLFRDIDRHMLIIAYLLISVGMIVQYRINPDIAYRQLTWIAVGMGAMLLMIALMRRPDFWKSWRWVFMGGSIGLLGLVFAIGRTTYGAKNWINVAGFSFQPSEFIKIALILVLATELSEKRRIRQIVWPLGAFVMACLAILMVSRDLGAALIYFCVTLILFYVATGNVAMTGLGIVGGAGASVMAYYLFDHVRMRVAIMKNPWASYDTSGYQIAQGLMAIASGGLFGMGLTRGTPKIIPAYHTDYIFAVICEEMGMVVGVCMLAFYVVLILRGVAAAMRCKESYTSLIACGVIAAIAIQTFLIIGGVIKMIPLTGVTMPFVSYGGSSMIASFMMLGLLESVVIHNHKPDTGEGSA